MILLDCLPEGSLDHPEVPEMSHAKCKRSIEMVNVCGSWRVLSIEKVNVGLRDVGVNVLNS